MAKSGKLEIQITGDTKDLERALSTASKKTEEFGGTLSKIGKTAALGAGAAGIGALTVGLKIGIDEFAQGAKVAAQTNAVLESTGKIAGVSAKQVSDMGTSLMKKSGIDDEVIKSGENMLLTFTNIRNEAGKGNDVFNQTTKTLLDMSVATGQDMTKSAVMLGKAINDPIAGIGALSRVGVTFTEGQKETIKALVKSGDAMGAQKIILHEMNKEFGGSAEALGKTLPGQINIAKQTFSNFAGDLVAKMIPVLQQAIGWLKDHWPDIQAALKSFWSSAKPILQNLMDLLAAIWPIAMKAIQLFLPVLKDVAQVVAGVVKLVSALLSGDWSQAWEAAKTIVMGVVNTIRDYLKAAVTIWWGAISGVFQAVFVTPFQNAWNAVSNWVKDHWVDIVVVAIGGFPGLAWVLFSKQLESVFVTPFKTAWTAVSTWVKEHWVDIVVTVVGGLPALAWKKLWDAWGSDFATKLQKAFTEVGTWITDEIKRWAGYVAALPGKIRDFGADLLKQITGYVTNSGIAKFLTERVTAFAGFFESLPGKIGDALVRGAKGAIDKVKGWFNDLFGWLPGWAKDILGIHSPSKVFEEIGEHIVSGLMKGMSNMAGALKKHVEAAVIRPIDWAKKAVSNVGSMVGDLVTGGPVGTANGSLQLPDLSRGFPWAPHDTLGLPGYPAVDVMAPGNTVALSPAAGKIVKESGHPFSDGWSNGPGSAIGLSMYLMSQAGEYFMTHFSSLYRGVGATIGAGAPLGVVGPMDQYGVAAHIHEGFHAFAKGGIVSRPTMALLGEAGPEAVIPLNRMGGAVVNVYVEGTVVSENQLVDAVYRGLVRKSGRNSGNLGLA